MKLTNLVSILRSGNKALGQKLDNLLTEDCTILEYTDDAVLFTKNGHLVLAKFKHDLSESRLSPDNILDNEVVYISGKETETSLKEGLLSVIDNLIEEDYIRAEENLALFTETYYQYFALKSRYPELFSENLKKQSKGFKLRKAALDKLDEFKSEVFSTVSLRESKKDSIDYSTLLESVGEVLVLGKTKLLPHIQEALLGHTQLAEKVANQLFETAMTLPESNRILETVLASGYNLVEGFDSDEETPDEVSNEDLTAPLEPEEEFETDEFEEGPKEFVEFDPAKLSDEELKELHKTVLASILKDMEEFVATKSNDELATDIPADLDSTLKTDLALLDAGEISDEDLTKIEAKWQPIISYFLDSDMYKPEQELEPDEDVSDVISGGEEEETADETTPEPHHEENKEEDEEENQLVNTTADEEQEKLPKEQEWQGPAV